MCVASSVQDYFTHYPGHGLLATTHIILKTAEGEKYNHAVLWGVPALADRYVQYTHSYILFIGASSSLTPGKMHACTLHATCKYDIEDRTSYTCTYSTNMYTCTLHMCTCTLQYIILYTLSWSMVCVPAYCFSPGVYVQLAVCLCTEW